MLCQEYRALKSIRAAKGTFPISREGEEPVKALLAGGLVARAGGEDDGFGGEFRQKYIDLTRAGEKAFLEAREARRGRAVSMAITVLTLAASIVGAIAALVK